MKMRPFGRLLAVPTARLRLERAIRPVERTEFVSLDGAPGRIAARDVRSARPVPSVDRASWDGYAVRSRDTAPARAGRAVRLRVVAELFAEESSRRRLRPGEAMAVATGASLPPGADTVVIFEEVARVGSEIRLRRPAHPGERLARVGHDIARGDRLVRREERIGPASVGALAACGRARLAVYARPTVGLLATGNELRLPGSATGKGTVYECNLPPLAAVVRAAGCEPRPYSPIPDDPKAIRRVLLDALAECDIVVASGGSSVGERDHLPAIVRSLGPLLFHGLAVRPGKPTLAGRHGRKVVLGLPGHPASCLTNAYWLLLPALRRLARQPGPGYTSAVGVLRGPPLVASPTMSSVVTFSATDRGLSPTFHGSSAVTSLASANAFTILPPRARTVRRGGRLPYYRLEPPLGN